MRSALLRALTLGLLAALMALAVACGSDDEGDDGGNGDNGGEQFVAPTEAPDDAQRGGTVTVLSSGDVDNIDPGAAYYQFTWGFVSYPTQRPLYSWRPGDTDESTPDLAEGPPQISDDSRTVTVTLRDDVRFSPPVDRAATSQDVKYAIERGLLPGVANGYVEAYYGSLEGFDEAQQAVERNDRVAPDISGIETPDDRTIVFNLSRPVATFFSRVLSLPLSAPVPEDYAKEFDAQSPSEYGMHQVFTGPYKVTSDASGRLTGYNPGRRIEIERNPNWDAETDHRPAYLDGYVIEEGYSDTASASRKILNGSAQLNGDFPPPPAVLKQAAQSFEDQLTLTPSGGNRYIALNTQQAPFDDINVRKAVLAGADREALRLTRGGELVGGIATHFIPPEIPGFEEAGGEEGPGVDFLAEPSGDPELAAEYMREAGFSSGKYEGGRTLLMVGDDSGVGRKTAEVALRLFQELGFEVNFRPVTHDIMYTRFCGRPAADVAICPNVGWLKDFNDPQTILDPTFNGDNIQEVNNVNWPQLDVPEINRAMEDAKTINDPEERAQAWGKIDQMIVEQAPAIPWIWDNQANIRSSDVAGVINKFDAVWDMSYTSLER